MTLDLPLDMRSLLYIASASALFLSQSFPPLITTETGFLHL